MLSAVEFAGYSKLLRLTSPNDAALGQLITFTTSDHDRIQDAVVNGVMFIGTPVMFLMSITYSVYLIGPSAIVGSVVVLCFYPLMVSYANITCFYSFSATGIHCLPFKLPEAEGCHHHRQTSHNDERDHQLHEIDKDVCLGTAIHTED